MARSETLRAIKVNCKQCKIYKISINDIEVSPSDFYYYDLTQEITKKDLANNQYSLDQFANSHKYAVQNGDPDAGNGKDTIISTWTSICTNCILNYKRIKIF